MPLVRSGLLKSGCRQRSRRAGERRGYPFVPGASGNTALEDMLYALRPAWPTLDRFRLLVAAGQDLLDTLDESQRRRAAEGAIQSTASHP